METMEKILGQLCKFPHRGATTTNEQKCAHYIANILAETGISVNIESFKSPETYGWEIIGIALLGVLSVSLGPFYPNIAAMFAALSLWFFYRHFTGQKTPLTVLNPNGISQNVIAEIKPENDANQHVVLMAHYDTTRKGLLWHPRLIGNFRKSFQFDAALHFLLVPWVWLGNEFGTYPWYQLICLGIGLFYIVQIGIFLQREIRPEYVNGANDNASGVSLILKLAEYFRNKPLENTKLQLVFTGAEEAGMHGAHTFIENHESEITQDNTFILNFDNIGAGNLNYCSGEGMLSFWAYDQYLVKAASELTELSEFQSMGSTRYTLAYFDTLPFVQQGYKCISFIGLDDNSAIPNWHWNTDTPDRIDWNTMNMAFNFGKKYIQKIDRNGVSK
ncbi:MAG: M28 family peptidase [Candidatus Marinimicrobia bacterium]|nr:M28 family peptidase [Candidatus Neomarinimicrobiota bacterium]